ncbi:hypothetical protein Cgig2_006670 [Carnegiea gigantea]|uniref:Uncharacterized protein n=1 Tax=Carnegiea gigantea TaxID=171969 RepID=A0A9Q1JYM7_9CARY|nr:hypothetical protein Cgig2_006670 [Carnegiea gigantea]
MDDPGPSVHGFIGLPPMAFPHFLDTKAMSEFVSCHFSWDRRGITFPQSPFPKEFQTLCPGFELAVAEQSAKHYKLLEVPQVIFYSMLLNEAKRLGVLHGKRLRSLEVTLTELHWSAFESWLWLFGDRIYEARFHPKGGLGENAGADRERNYTAHWMKWRSKVLEMARGKVHIHVLLKHYVLYIMSSSCSSSGDIPEGLAGPQVEGWNLQFSNLLALIDGWVVAGIPRKNKYRERKKIPYAVPLFEPGTSSWSSCEYSSTPSILSPKVEVTYPWEITIANYMSDFQVCRMAKTKFTPRIRSPGELLANGTLGNPCSAPSQSNPEAEVASTSSSASSGTGSSSSSSGHSSRSSSSEGASTSSSSLEASLGPGKSLLKYKGRTPPVTGIVVEGSEFPGAPTHSDLQDGPGSHFPDPRPSLS